MVQQQERYYYGTGKRKTSVARVKIYNGDSNSIIVNNKPMEEYFNWQPWQDTVKQALSVSNNLNNFRVEAKVYGGGVNSQAEAIRHGITRALIAYDENLKKELRQAGLVTRDSRIKESKKYGLKRARRAPQYTKR
ncbi:MAG: 30S ribosomal protein S9 [SAR202 cluster bacterium]|nr:30S ribosomal protein S9 [Dehalococcoidia bacterium]MQG35519.1 30S ribosomal protein S9 [SAR202 cluster bacterium]MQG60581.1 30S ribosomal protein S9 [SAR202 cluster bacterium]MQG86117.1 30S ribosomal protein S9 [SAR202 cluster bacterium]CAI8290914.1 MAG: 30S ribosomal protein S9 [Chloroflexota bacterium]